MKNRILCVLFSVIFISLSLCSCSYTVYENAGDKLTIICSIFTPYDFAKQIAGDKAEIKMLLSPGVESHSYEPTPADIIAIENADVFFYVSENTETWVPQITNAVENPNVKIFDIASILDVNIHDDEHEDGGEHDSHEELAKGEMDEHIWTNLETSMKMVNCIAEKISEVDPQNEDYYMNNAKEYIGKIASLDANFKTLVSTSKRHEIVSGSRFAMRNFTIEYGIAFTAAFDSCVDNTEPSATVMATIIDTIKNDNIPVIFYEELTEPKIARAVSLETDAKMLLLHSCHNVTADEFKSGASYVSIMTQNYENLKEALN